MLVFGIWKINPEEVTLLACSWRSQKLQGEVHGFVTDGCVYPLNEFQAFKLNTKLPGQVVTGLREGPSGGKESYNDLLSS